MALSDEEIGFVTDLFADLGPLSTRKMFGGLGIYLDGAIFALVRSDGALLLKGVGDMVNIFNAEGWVHWTYQRKNGAKSAMPYWEMPNELRDDPTAACDWARRAVAHL
jgi:DNA transformation protein